MQVQLPALLLLWVALSFELEEQGGFGSWLLFRGLMLGLLSSSTLYNIICFGCHRFEFGSVSPALYNWRLGFFDQGGGAAGGPDTGPTPNGVQLDQRASLWPLERVVEGPLNLALLVKYFNEGLPLFA